MGLTGYNTLARNDQSAVMSHLTEVGPLAIGVFASGWSGYSGGVYEGCDYEADIAINHAVQLVGYGTDQELGHFWLVRNSWGEGWGERGYIRLRREAEAEVRCGTDYSLCGNTVQVCGQCGLLFDVSFPLGVHHWNGQ